MTENFPQLISDTKPQTQEAQRTPIRVNTKEKRLKSPESSSLPSEGY